MRSDENNLNYKYLYSMPVLGGPASLLIKDVDCAPSFSPDGRQFVFTRGTPSRNVTEVLVANADGTGVHVLAAFPNGHRAYNPGATWSPDGKTDATDQRSFGYDLSIDLSRDGRTLAATVSTQLSNIWVAPSDQLSAARQLTFGELRCSMSPKRRREKSFGRVSMANSGG